MRNGRFNQEQIIGTLEQSEVRQASEDMRPAERSGSDV